MKDSEADFDLTLTEIFDTLVPGYAEWLLRKEYLVKFLRELNAVGKDAPFSSCLAFSRAMEVTSYLVQTGNTEAMMGQLLGLISLGYFLALKEHRMLDKDLN